MKSSTPKIIVAVSVMAINIFLVIFLAVTFDGKEKAKEDKHTNECTDSMAIVVVWTFNENQRCNHPQQKIEVYPAGGERVLVKCVCPRKENKEKIGELR